MYIGSIDTDFHDEQWSESVICAVLSFRLTSLYPMKDTIISLPTRFLSVGTYS